MSARLNIYHTLSGWVWDLFSYDQRLMTPDRFVDGNSGVSSWKLAWWEAQQAWEHFVESPDWQTLHHEETEQ